MRGIRLGEILVEQRLLTPVQVAAILHEQRTHGRPFGVLAERMFGLTPAEVEAAWVQQYARLSPAVDVDAMDVEPDCLMLIDRRQAWQFQCAPVWREGGELVVLTDQKHLAKALRFASATFGEPTFIRLVRTDVLQEFLMAHYPVSAALAELAAMR